MKNVIAALALTILVVPAHAEFEIEEAETAVNSVELQISTGLFLGGVKPGDERFATETEIIWGVFPGFSTGLSFEVGGERDGSPAFEQMELESTFAFIGRESLFGLTPANGEDPVFSLVLFTGLELELDEPDDIVLAAGPAFAFEFDDVASTTNLFFTFPLGGGAKTGFSYGTSLMFEITEYTAIGVEAYGTIENVFDGPGGFNTQEHFIGPAISFEFELENDTELNVRLGSFFGLTNETPTVALSLNIEVEFN